MIKNTIPTKPPVLKQQGHTQEEQEAIDLSDLSEKNAVIEVKIINEGRKKIPTISHTQYRAPTLPILISINGKEREKEKKRVQKNRKN